MVSPFRFPCLVSLCHIVSEQVECQGRMPGERRANDSFGASPGSWQFFGIEFLSFFLIFMKKHSFLFLKGNVNANARRGRQDRTRRSWNSVWFLSRHDKWREAAGERKWKFFLSPHHFSPPRRHRRVTTKSKNNWPKLSQNPIEFIETLDKQETLYKSFVLIYNSRLTNYDFGRMKLSVAMVLSNRVKVTAVLFCSQFTPAWKNLAVNWSNTLTRSYHL